MDAHRAAHPAQDEGLAEASYTGAAGAGAHTCAKEKTVSV